MKTLLFFIHSIEAAMYLVITIGIILIGVIVVLAYSPPVQASGGHDDCHHDCGTDVTKNFTLNKDNDSWKYVAQGIIHTCRLHAVYIGFKEGRWLTWCGEDRTRPEPLPDGGPVVNNDVTPDPQPTGIKFK